MKYLKMTSAVLMIFLAGCTKFLDAVPDKSLTVPNTIADYQALLENELMFDNMPALGEVSADDLYLPDALWGTLDTYVRDAYCWNKDLNEGKTSLNWNYPYQKIYYANIVLDGIEGVRSTSSSSDVDVLKGWALFCRANAFYDLEEIFGQPYRPASASQDLGIPLRLNTNLTNNVQRATVAVTFQQIITDLEQSIILLPSIVNKTDRAKPSKAAAYALLSRVYLTMQKYDLALLNANHCLTLYSVLVDYNSLNPAAKYPFNPLTDEVMYNSAQLYYADRSWQVGQEFYQSYAATDLRKTLFYTFDPVAKTAVFKGFYSAVIAGFNGLATDETYFIKAECEARKGNDEAALAAINTVLIKRFKTGAYIPYSINLVNDVLSLVLTEKRKECLFRNVRWSDLRRLNQDTRFAKNLIRTVNGIRYELPPNDPRYSLPIPNDEIRINGLQQNLR